MIDLAFDIIVGAAFAIMRSLVADLFTGGIDVSNLFVALGAEDHASVQRAKAAGVAAFAKGASSTP